MNKHILLSLFVALLCVSIPKTILAHEPGSGEVVFVPKKLYLSSDFDGYLFTIGLDNGTRPLNVGRPTTVSTPRFTYFFNIGFNANYDFNKTIGLFSGLSIKNIGFIEKQTSIDSTIKRRVYTAGVPLGIKVGNLSKKNYFFIGGGVDFPFNYKEKGYVKRSKKDKFNEWFSDRTPSIMPYGFVGASFNPGIFFKVQYYPNNFMNASYTSTQTINGNNVSVQPYALYDIQLLMFSVGFNIRYSTKMKINHKDNEGRLQPMM